MMSTMPMQTYEAVLSKAQHVAQARAAKSALERVGGRIDFMPAAQPGMTLIVVMLPSGYLLDAFLPGLPFYLT